MTLLAFHNDNAIRQKYLDRVRAHKDADEIIQGAYWENGRVAAQSAAQFTASNMPNTRQSLAFHRRLHGWKTEFLRG